MKSNSEITHILLNKDDEDARLKTEIEEVLSNIKSPKERARTYPMLTKLRQLLIKEENC
jgi:hypothetical protein